MQTKTTKRVFSVLLTLALCLGLLVIAPVMVQAAPPVSGTTWTFTASSPNETNVAYGGGTYSWVQSTKTLTLNNVNHSTTAADALDLPNDSTLVLNGANEIISTYNGGATSIGIFCNGIFTITGNGSLNAVSGESSFSSYGIFPADNLNVNGGTITAIGGSCGINVTSGSPRLIINGGTVTAVGGNFAIRNSTPWNSPLACAGENCWPCCGRTLTPGTTRSPSANRSSGSTGS